METAPLLWLSTDFKRGYMESIARSGQMHSRSGRQRLGWTTTSTQSLRFPDPPLQWTPGPAMHSLQPPSGACVCMCVRAEGVVLNLTSTMVQHPTWIHRSPPRPWAWRASWRACITCILRENEKHYLEKQATNPQKTLSSVFPLQSRSRRREGKSRGKAPWKLTCIHRVVRRAVPRKKCVKPPVP